MKIVRIAKWTMAALALLSVAVWITSANWVLSYHWNGTRNLYGVFIGSGCCGRGIVLSNPGTGWWFGWEGGQEWFARLKRYELYSCYPAWWLPAAALPLTAALFIIGRRRRTPAGHCLQCGYDLRGAVSDRCSECGTTVTDGDKRRSGS